MNNEFENGFGSPVPGEPQPETVKEEEVPVQAETPAQPETPVQAEPAAPEQNSTYHYTQSQINQAPVNPVPPVYSAPQAQPQPQAQTYYNPTAPQAPPVYTAPAAVKAKKKISKTAIIATCAVIVCIILAVVGIVSSVAGSKGGNTDSQDNTVSESAQVETQDQAEIAKTDNDGNYTVAGVAENCIDSCVGITIYSKSSTYSNFYGFGYGNDSYQGGEETVSGYGSGIFMLESNGKTYVMTCAHVISDGTRFVVTTNDGEEYDATVVGYDSQTDIGVLVINKTGFKIAQFANSDSTIVGEQVVAIGCPGGLDFMNSVSSGYVSALDRPIKSTIGYKNECIQTDTAINPGNSGGALFNMQGQVIGVNSSKIAATEYEGIGFAVPSNTAVATANSLIKVGYVEGRAKIGITYTNIGNYSNASAILNALERLGYEDAQGTMVINEVNSNSDLKNKDIRQYDMIVAVNGETMTSTDVLTAILSDSKPGDTVTLTIARIENNEIDTFEVECELIEAKG